MGSPTTESEKSRDGEAWYVPAWLEAARPVLEFDVCDARSAQGRLETRTKRVTLDDLVLFHGHVCDGLLRGAYAMRALGDVAFEGRPFDRTDLLVVSKNSPCLGDVAAYLTGGRGRFGTLRLNNDLGVGYVVRELSSERTWEVREEAGFFPSLISQWEAALLDDSPNAHVTSNEKAELVAVNEARQWSWVREVLLASRPGDHYTVRSLEAAEIPEPLYEARRTDVVNRHVRAPSEYVTPYEPLLGGTTPRLGRVEGSTWEDRYDRGPTGPRVG